MRYEDGREASARSFALAGSHAWTGATMTPTVSDAAVWHPLSPTEAAE
jgi:hypothetical protein